MKKKVIWIVLAAVLVGVIVGAGALYRKLSGDAAPALPTVSAPWENGETSVEQRTEETVFDVPSTEAAEPAPPAGKKAAAADFTVLDENGDAVSLSSHFGKPLVVNFWATWCGPCRSELPEFDEAAKRYAGTIDFMMVNLTDGYNDTVDSVKAFVQENGYAFPVYFDTQESAAAAYGVYSIPLTVLIRADGTVMQTYTGSMSGDVLNGFLEELVS